MKKNIVVEDCFEIQRVIHILCDQHIEYPINIAYRLNKLKKEIDDITEYIINRTIEILPSIKDNVQLSDNEKMVYYEIMHSQLDIDNQDLTIEDITSSCSVKLDIGSCGILNKLF